MGSEGEGGIHSRSVIGNRAWGWKGEKGRTPAASFSEISPKEVTIFLSIERSTKTRKKGKSKITTHCLVTMSSKKGEDWVWIQHYMFNPQESG